MFNLRKKYRQIFFGQCAILLYHRVTDAETDPQLLAVSPDNFDSHLAFLKKNYTVLSIEELTSKLLKGENLPNKSVAITFDDGYADNYHEALPILKKHDLQALFYICTGNLDTPNEFWWDEVERHLLLTENVPSQLNLSIAGNEIVFDTQTSETRFKTYNQLLPLFRKLRTEFRNEQLSYLSEWSGNKTPRYSHRSMTMGELTSLFKSPHAILGAHTHNHPSLAAIYYIEQVGEIAMSKNILEKLTGTTIKHFSYPFGTYLDYNQNTMEICKMLKIELTAANFPDTTDCKSDKLRLPRFLVRNWNEKEFSIQLKQFFN